MVLLVKVPKADVASIPKELRGCLARCPGIGPSFLVIGLDGELETAMPVPVRFESPAGFAIFHKKRDAVATIARAWGRDLDEIEAHLGPVEA